MRTDAKTWITRVLVKLTLVLFAAHPAVAAATGMLTVRWDANTTDLDLAGYRVYITTDAGLFTLPPAQALPLATTRVVGVGITETIFTTLNPTLVYWVGVTSLDASSNESVFSDVVSGQPRDGNAPAVSVDSPATGATLSGVVNIVASASDDVGVAGVQILIDGLDFGVGMTTAPYTVSWDTTSFTNGAHAVRARAWDAAGNVTLSSLTGVTVTNYPPGTCAPGADPDADGVCSANDNCPKDYNPSQQNTDNDSEGGDACDITVLSPTSGGAMCSGPAPTISWSPEIYNRFRVFVGADDKFSTGINSGKSLLTSTSWVVPAASWQTICNKTNQNLYIKIFGKRQGAKREYSEILVVRGK